jgi:hypothetical protein
VHTDNAGDGGGTPDALRGNHVSACAAGGYGVWVFVPYLAPVVEDNTITGCAVGLAAFGQGAAVTTSFSGNFVDGGHAADSVGMYVTTDQLGFGAQDVSVALSCNSLINNAIGFQVEQQGAAQANATLHNNNIAHNSVAGAQNNTTTTVDATNNWWGAAGGPTNPGNPGGTGDVISGPVTFTPWLSDPAPCAPGDFHGPATSNVGAAPNPAPLGSPVTLSATVSDVASGNSNIAGAEYQVGSGPWTALAATDGAYDSPSENVDATIPASAFAAPGVYNVCVRGADVAGNQGAAACVMVAVYDPNGGFVTGGGWINSPAGAYAPDPTLTGRANFAFVSRYERGANRPSGQTQFRFQAAGLDFQSASYDWLVIGGARAQYRGSGTLNGAAGYTFILTAIDGQVSGGGGADKLRMKIMGPGGVVYDNQMNDPDSGDPTTVLGGGSIVIHR